MIKFLAAVICFPTAALVCWEAAKGLYQLLLNWRACFSFLAGAGLYAAVHYLLFAPARLYVAAHELTHAFAGLLCGYRVKDMSVGKDGGYVVVSGSNVFVALAPYCVPLYAVVASVCFAGLSLFYETADYLLWFTGVIGFFMAFHMINTFETIYREKQSDLRHAGGVFFSVTLILLSNALMVLGTAKVFYPEFISLRAAAGNVGAGTAVFWKAAGEKTAAAAYTLYGAARK